MITCIQYKTSHRHTFGESIRQKNSAGIINMHVAQTLETNILYKHKKDEQNSTNITETYSTNIRHAYSTTIRDIHMVQASETYIRYKRHRDTYGTSITVIYIWYKHQSHYTWHKHYIDVHTIQAPQRYLPWSVSRRW